MTHASMPQRLGAEALGSALLLATVIGSGIMGERLAGGNEAMALLANTLATAAILVVLITMLAPLSGAHFNPAVTAVFWARRDIGGGAALAYIAVQLMGAIAGVLLAHAMFELPILQISAKARSGAAQGLSEAVATFGLIATVLLTLRARPAAVASAVGLYIGAAYWFTASTSFANPAVTLARALSDTFAGIRPQDAPLFVAAQAAGAACGLLVAALLAPAKRPAIAEGRARASATLK